MVDAAVSDGAEIVTGGGDRGLVGLFYEPTIVRNVSNANALCQNEVFGPMLPVLSFDDEKQAIAMANDSRFGLAAGVWANDIQRALE